MALDANEVRERFGKAKGNADLWLNQLQQAYNYTMPNRAEFAIHHWTPGTPRTEHIYDPTATIGLRKFAANLQNLLMPAGHHWCRFVPGKAVMQGKTDVDPRQAKQECQDWEDIFFDQLNKSNFQHAMYQSIMEMGISTGVLLLNEGTQKDPLRFKSVPLHQVALEPGAGDTVENVYREFRLQARVIPQTSPKAILTDSINRQIETDGSQEVELLEGTIFVPDAKGKNKYCYFILEKSSNKFLLQEYRDFSPWIDFRWNVYAGEVFGRGPIVDLLPFIKDLNKLAEFDLRAASFNANPIFLVATGSELNPYTTRIEPGALIPIQPNGVNQNPIQQLQITGQPTYSQLEREVIVTALNNYLNINPIVTPNNNQKTATEVNIQNAEWLRENQSMVGRFERECNHPVVKKVWRVLNKFGYVQPLEIDDELLTVEYDSPLREAQNLQDVQKVVQCTQMMNEILGPQYAETGILYGYDIEKLPTWIAEKLEVDVNIIRDALSRQKMKNMVAQQAQGQLQQGNANLFQNNQPSTQGAA